MNRSRAPPEATRPGDRAGVWEEGLRTALEKRAAEDRLKRRKTFLGTLGQQSSDSPRKRSTLVGRDEPQRQSQICLLRGFACVAEMRYHREVFPSAPL